MLAKCLEQCLECTFSVNIWAGHLYHSELSNTLFPRLSSRGRPGIVPSAWDTSVNETKILAWNETERDLCLWEEKADSPDKRKGAWAG